MDLNQNILIVIAGLSILIGALQCFFGYRIFKFILGFTGFLLGGALASFIGFNFSHEIVYTILVGLLGGFIGATLMVALYFVGVFLVGAIFGGILGSVLYVVFQSNPDPVVLLTIAVISGVIALIFQKFIIIVSTGFAGAGGVVAGITYFISEDIFILEDINLNNVEQIFRSGDNQLYAILLCWLALGIVGIIVQYRSEPQKMFQNLDMSDSKEGSALSSQVSRNVGKTKGKHTSEPQNLTDDTEYMP